MTEHPAAPTTREVEAQLWYPRANAAESTHTVRVSLWDVRAADDLVISYDFDRDGYSIKMATVHEWGVDEEPDPHLIEVAFVPAWVDSLSTDTREEKS